MNALLWKYGSFLACIGQEDKTREKYLEIAARASLNEISDHGEFGDGEAGAPKHYKELASFTLQHVTDGLEKLLRVSRSPRREET